MATMVADYFELIKGMPAGTWVAISESQHKVISYGDDAQAVLTEAREQGENLPLMMRVPDQNSAMFF